MPFTDALAHAREHRNPLMQFRDGMHEFHDQDGLADPGAAEQAGLAAAHEGTEQVDDLDAGLEDAAGRHGFMQGGGPGEHRPQFPGRQRRAAIERFAEQVEQSTETLRPHRHAQRPAGIVDRHAPGQAGGAVQRDRTDAELVEMLVHLEHIAFGADGGVQGLMQRRQGFAGDIHDRAVDLGDEPQRGSRYGRFRAGLNLLRLRHPRSLP